MMSRSVVVASAVLVTGGIAATQALAGGHAAAARSHAVRITATANDPSSFTNISAKLGGSLGAGKQASCCLVLPKTTYTWRFKGGTIHATGVSKIKGSSVTGTWKVTKGKGTGTFKGITGGGTFTGELTTGKYVYKGSVRY